MYRNQPYVYVSSPHMQSYDYWHNNVWKPYEYPNLHHWRPYEYPSLYHWNHSYPNLYPSNHWGGYPGNLSRNLDRESLELKDYGSNPFVINIAQAAKQNNEFRVALWTGSHLQLTLMSVPIGGEIGLERHMQLDQFLRVEAGQGVVYMGDRKDRLTFQRTVRDDDVILIPAGQWHNLINTGNQPIKLYSIYAPPQHPFGTVHSTKAEADAAEQHSATLE